jgi:hypothetical protein
MVKALKKLSTDFCLVDNKNKTTTATTLAGNSSDLH